MNPKTKAKMDEIVAAARDGQTIIPMMFQPFGPLGGHSNTVSAAIRAAKKQNLIEQDGVDGLGKPKYRAVMPKPTHNVKATVN